MIQFFKLPDRVFYCVSYIVFALPLVVFYAYCMPAFQVPDESSHFARAYQLTHGEFFPTKRQVPGKPGEYTVGGTVDPGIFIADSHYRYLHREPKPKLLPAKSALANEIRWQDGEMRDTRNVSVYPPTFYVVPALGIMLGQFLDMSIVESLTLSRLINGVFSLCLISMAILTLRKGFGLFFVILLMPMTLAQVASTSQDAICFAVAALCVALMSQLSPEMELRKRRWFFVLSAILMVTMAGARPPYLALSLFYLYIALISRDQKFFVIECCIAFFATWLATVLWSLYVTLYVSVPFGLEGVDYTQQALFMLQSPFAWLEILAESWRQRWDLYLYSFVGIVGHLDTAFPIIFYRFALLTLCLAFLMSFLSERNLFFKELYKQALVPCLIVLATIVGMFAVLYISWSPLKNPIVEGPLGRYFIPAALFLALGCANKALTGYSQVAYRCMILSFAMVTAIITPYVVLARYY